MNNTSYYRNQITHVQRYSKEGEQMVFYVRCLVEKIPKEKKLNFKEDKNYPVLGTDSINNKILIPDDQNKLLWLPNSLFRFVKIA